MNEEQRQLAVQKINKVDEELKNFETVAWEYCYLRNADPQVRRYLELEEKIREQRRELEPYLKPLLCESKRLDEIIYKTIDEQVFETLGNYHEGQRCNHPIWVVLFTYDNVYRCLECGSAIEPKDSEEFEKQNQVLKLNETITFHECQKLYYRYLYEMPTEEAVQKLIRKFNI